MINFSPLILQFTEEIGNRSVIIRNYADRKSTGAIIILKLFTIKRLLCTAHIFQDSNSEEEKDVLIFQNWRLFAGSITVIRQREDNDRKIPSMSRRMDGPAGTVGRKESHAHRATWMVGREESHAHLARHGQWATGPGLKDPVFQLYSRYALKFPDVVRHNSHVS